MGVGERTADMCKRLVMASVGHMWEDKMHVWGAGRLRRHEGEDGMEEKGGLGLSRGERGEWHASERDRIR